MGATKKLADLCLGIRCDDLPVEAVVRAKECILDTLGCMLAGSCSEEGALMVKYAEELGGNPEATVVGFGRKTSAPLAALVNGALGHALDFDDAQDSIMGHPSVAVLPAVIATAEKTRSSGRDALEAFLAGFEAACKIGKGVNPRLYENGWHATGVVGALGATVASGRLFGLDATAMAAAMGLAASLSSGLRENFGTMTKPLHAGRAAENGVVAARLVKAGFTASGRVLEAKNGFCAVFSGEYEIARILDGFADPPEIVAPGVRLKPYPSCLETHSIIEASLHLADAHNIKPEEVESVECALAPLAVDILIHNNPMTGLEGKFSAPYAVATALAYRKASLAQFTDAAVRDQRAQMIMNKVRVVPAPDLEKNIQSCVVTVHLTDGRVFADRVDITTGHPKKPMAPDQITAKFRSCAAGAIDEEQREEAIRLVLDLEQMQEIGQLMALLH